MLTAFFLVIFFVCVAMMWNEGLWSNAITLVNVVVAAMIATNYFEPLAAVEPVRGEAESSFCVGAANFGAVCSVEQQ